jgi:hypothetical protein
MVMPFGVGRTIVSVPGAEFACRAESPPTILAEVSAVVVCIGTMQMTSSSSMPPAGAPASSPVARDPVIANTSPPLARFSDGRSGVNVRWSKLRSVGATAAGGADASASCGASGSNASCTVGDSSGHIDDSDPSAVARALSNAAPTVSSTARASTSPAIARKAGTWSRCPLRFPATCGALNQPGAG